MSAFKSISASIIQGSAVGPASYVVNGSDLHTVSDGNDLLKYADDTYLIIKGTLHSVEKNPYTEGLLCLLLHSEGTAIFLCRLTA